tara:strand:+ start:4494 stop:4934 length:441 start_codon:yes stop_codon:yes gene_type:complete
MEVNTNQIIAYLFQIISLIIFITVIIVDLKTKYAINKDIQLIVAIIIMFVFIVIDPFAGFLMACTAFVIYYKNYMKKRSVHWDKYNTYIKESNLNDIQNNIFDKNDFKKETIGFNDGFIETSNPVYGIQGMNKDMPGYDNNTLSEF